MITRRALSLVIGLGWCRFANAASSGTSPHPPPTLSSADILAALARHHILSSNRKVLRATHIGDIMIDGAGYPAINLVEEHATAHSVRLFRRVVLLKPNLNKAFELPYYLPAEPVSCHDDVLVFSEAIEINNTLPAGREVMFMNGGVDAEVIASH
jgi:hypothetical protein